MNIFPEFHPLTYTFLSSLKGSVENGIEDSLVGYQVNSSQFIGHLNKAPVNLQSLPLLLVLVGDRQHKCWLFCIPIYKRLEYGRKENYIELKNSEMRQIVVGRKSPKKYTKKISPQ